MKSTQVLRDLLDERKIVPFGGCYDAFSARVAEKAGFEALYLSGFALSAAYLGMPDVNLMSMTEIATIASRITDVIKVPLIADGETGFGGPLQLRRTVRLYEKAGLAGFHIEDQVYPKKGGSLAGRALVSTEEMVGKIKAATDARQDKDFLVIARTDARDISFDESVTRANAYLEAGADIAMVLPQNSEEVEKYPKVVKGPTLILVSDHRPYTVLPVQEFEKMGYKMVWFILSAAYAAGKALTELWETVMKTGSTKEFVEKGRMLTINEVTDLLELPEHRDFETKYMPKSEVEARYGKKQWGV